MKGVSNPITSQKSIGPLLADTYLSFPIIQDANGMIGSNLSAGQRQLISLARALLTPTNILGKSAWRVALWSLIAT